MYEALTGSHTMGSEEKNTGSEQQAWKLTLAGNTQSKTRKFQPRKKAQRRLLCPGGTQSTGGLGGGTVVT